MTPSAAEKQAIQFIAEYENGSSELVTEALDRILRRYSKTLREIKEDEDVIRHLLAVSRETLRSMPE